MPLFRQVNHINRWVHTRTYISQFGDVLRQCSIVNYIAVSTVLSRYLGLSAGGRCCVIRLAVSLYQQWKKTKQEISSVLTALWIRQSSMAFTSVVPQVSAYWLVLTCMDALRHPHWWAQPHLKITWMLETLDNDLQLKVPLRSHCLPACSLTHPKQVQLNTDPNLETSKHTLVACWESPPPK